MEGKEIAVYVALFLLGFGIVGIFVGSSEAFSSIDETIENLKNTLSNKDDKELEQVKEDLASLNKRVTQLETEEEQIFKEQTECPYDCGEDQECISIIRAGTIVRWQCIRTDLIGG